MNRIWLWAILGVTAFLASCSPPVPDLDDIIDWCYRFDFGVSLDFLTPQAGQLIQRDDPVLTINPNWGFKSVDNLIQLSGQYDRIVTPRFVRVTIARPTIVSGAIDITGVGNVFGIVINNSGTIPGNVNEIELVFEPRFVGDGSAIFSAQIQSSDVILLRKVEVFGLGSSPFPTNPCDRNPTPAPTPMLGTNTPTPAATMTPSPTPTNTPASTNTPVSGCEQAYHSSHGNNPVSPTYLTQSTPAPVPGIYGPTNFAGWSFQTGQWLQINLGGISQSATHTVSFNRNNSGTYEFQLTAWLNGTLVQSSGIYGATFWNTNSNQQWTVTVPHDAIRVTALTISGGTGFLRSSTIERCNFIRNLPTSTPSPTSAFTATNTPAPPTATATRTPIPTMTALPPTRTPIIVGTPTPRPTSTPLSATNTPGPTATATPSRTPMPRATIVTSTPITIVTSTPNPSVTPDPNAIIVSEIRDGFSELQALIEDSFGNLLGGLGDILSAIINGFMGLFDFLWSIFAGIGAPIEAIIALIAGIIQWIIDTVRAVIEALEEIIGIIRYIIEIAIGLFRILIAYLVVAARLVSELIGALFFAPPRPIPGLPLCVSDPLSYDICALYWAADWTLFAPGTPGQIIVPLLLIIMNVYVVLTFVRRAFSLINRGQKVTNVS